jgi:hypothetical protein
MIRASQLSATEKSLCANKLDLLYKKKSHRQWTNPGLSIRLVVITYIILSAWNSAFGTLSYGLEFLCFRLQFLFKWFSNNRFAVRFSFMHVIPIVGRLFQRVVIALTESTIRCTKYNWLKSAVAYHILSRHALSLMCIDIC